MRRFLSRHLETAIVAAIVAMMVAAAPAIAGTVADLAKNSLKLGGKKASAYQLKNKPIQQAFHAANADDAADSDQLDGIDSSGFYQTGSKVADSDKLDGRDFTSFLGSTIRARTTSVNVPDGGTGAGQVACAAGESLMGGGAAFGVFASDIFLLSSRPAKDAAGTVPNDGDLVVAWRAAAINPAGGTGAVSLSIYALCASAATK
jgi:hypothetical protein